MTYGILIRNIHGDVQIDGIYPNFYKEITGTASFSGLSSPGASTLYDATTEITFSSSISTDYTVMRVPTIQLDDTDYCCLYAGKRHTSSQYGYFLGEYDKSYNIPWALWMYATQNKEASEDTYGIHIYDATGKRRVFSSADRHMRFVGAYVDDCPIRSTNGVPGTSVYITVEDAFNNYFFLTHIGQSTDTIYKTGGTWVRYYYATMMRAYDATTVEVSSRLFAIDSGSSGVSASSRRTLGMSDITLTEIADHPQ